MHKSLRQTRQGRGVALTFESLFDPHPGSANNALWKMVSRTDDLTSAADDQTMEDSALLPVLKFRMFSYRFNRSTALGCW
jgi:hypothetical protein